ncbi:MAG: hypothetical protein GX657_17210 [Chloroflexi bacterium]|jgi:hypothetical protein|nr:hypothetical protein [Chloroflexota bacterium]
MYWLPPHRRRPPRRLTRLGELTLAIIDRPSSRRLLSYRAELVYDDGSTRLVSGDLARLLDGATLALLEQALAALRACAARRMIPAGGPAPSREPRR